MWRIFNGIPRVIRQHWNNARASSGIYKEDDLHCDCDPPVRSFEKRITHCRLGSSGFGANDGGNDTDRKKQDWWKRRNCDFWFLLSGTHRALEAVTWGAAVVLGIQLSNPRLRGAGCLPDDVKQEKTKRRCLLYHVAFALPGSRTKQNVLDSNSSIQKGAQKEEGAEESDAVTKVMTEFKNICSKYTAIGKNVLGLTKAKDGNMESAVQDLEESSELGHPGAQYNMGLCYELGQGVNMSLAQAAKFYSQAAASDHPKALYNLAMLYLKGEGGVTQDTKQAMSLLERAAQQGLSEAQTYLGVYYTEEEKQDMHKAVSFFTMAAEQNDPEAQFFLGICYEQGWGVETNECKAASLYNSASKNGHDGAMYNLGVFHEFGLGGLPEDRVSALDLFSKAASLGNESATFKLQEWYANAALLEWSAKFGTHSNSHLEYQFPLDKPAVTKSREPERVESTGFNSSASLPSLNTQICCNRNKVQCIPPLSPSVSSPTLTDLVKLNIDRFDVGNQFVSGFTKSAAEDFIMEQFMSKQDNSVARATFFLGDDCDETRKKTAPRSGFDLSEVNFCTTGLNRTQTMPDLLTVACP